MHMAELVDMKIAMNKIKCFLYVQHRQDGHTHSQILMPIDTPFYLLRFTSDCQEVLGMHVAEEFIFFDDEDGSNSDKCGGDHPFVDSGCSHANMRLHFCYYSTKPNQTEISIPGIFGWHWCFTYVWINWLHTTLNYLSDSNWMIP